MKTWHLLATVGLLALSACGENPVEADCCRVLTRVDITPDNATIEVGETVAFSALAYDEDDQSVQTDITWQVATAARGTIAANGTFLATSAGTTYVRAIVGALRDSALVTITAP